MARRGPIAFAAAVLAGLLLMRHADLSRLISHAEIPPESTVDDRISLLSIAERTSVAEYHAALRDAHDIDYRVLADNEGGDINTRAHRYFENEGIGTLSASGRGLLLVIDTELGRVRLEVSTALEGVFTDAFVAYIEDRQMVPFFNTNRIADGILATTELIVAQAQAAETGRAFMPPMPARSMGGGATTEADIGAALADTTEGATRTDTVEAAVQVRPTGTTTAAGTAASTIDDRSETAHRPTHEGKVSALGPLQVVETYHRAMAARDGRRNLPFYSAATIRMLEDWVMTPAQMDNVSHTYKACQIDNVRVRDGLAVVRYRIDQRQCAPYLLRSESGAWKLDLASMSSAIGFNHENQWHFRMPISSQYAYAFTDWSFDRHGFPHLAAKD